MRVAVLLQTCERPDLTALTVASFVAMNPDRSRFDLLHGDDASSSGENERVAYQHGFRTVVRTTERRGMLATRAALIDAAAHRGAEWLLLLENDCESVRAFPWALFDYVRRSSSLYCLRLFGQFKDAARRDACLTRNKWLNGQPVVWSPLRRSPEPAEIGKVHWTAQPAATRTPEAIGMHFDRRFPTSAQTARVVQNVMVHVGAARTPGRKQ